MQASNNNTMPKVATVTAQTNHGVQLLLGGRYHEAVNTFNDVLNQVRTLLADYDKLGSASCLLMMEEGSSSFCRFFCTTTNNNNDIMQRSNSTDGSIFLCGSPIIVNTEYASVAPFRALLKLSYVVLYNLALTYHLGALCSTATKKSAGGGGGGCEQIFRKALNCYEMAHDLQPSDDTELGVLLSLAIANNIGHIHGFIGNTAKAQQCFQHLLNTIMYVTGCSTTSTSSSSTTTSSNNIIIPSHLDGYMRNIQCFVLNSRHFAPAA